MKKKMNKKKKKKKKKNVSRLLENRMRMRESILAPEVPYQRTQSLNPSLSIIALELLQFHSKLINTE
ncbi:Hypothetical predicted protein [Octopus vulgaris]|uniref:Uncharacterized protein n=1 Tax=Octopus vulgaris TaxID=6645 RepID=A0AA36ASA9_OCTVU|nr:Hypothetical predicted protein [Octopus vulgaris]